MPPLSFFRFREFFCDILGVDECPREIIYLSDGFEPGGFCWKICRCMKVSDGWFNDWYFIDVVDGFHCTGAFGHECFYMVYYCCTGWDIIYGIS